jgi:hypothetical protein
MDCTGDQLSFCMHSGIKKVPYRNTYQCKRTVFVRREILYEIIMLFQSVHHHHHHHHHNTYLMLLTESFFITFASLVFPAFF